MQTLQRLRALVVITLFLFCFQNVSFAQLEMKLQNMPEENTWGVYVRPMDSINPTTNTITGSGQVTLVGPTGFIFGASSLFSISGNWANNARKNHPSEASDRDYLSFGFNTNYIKKRLRNIIIYF